MALRATDLRPRPAPYRLLRRNTTTNQSRQRPEITLDQQVALKTRRHTVGAQLRGTFGAATIERFLSSSYEQSADRATIVNFFPLLAERFARQRLGALANVEGLFTDRKPVVLFLCTYNAGRSQMAMGFFQHLAGGTAVAWSGGSEPEGEMNQAAVCGHGRAWY